jgi:hypothetical protein
MKTYRIAALAGGMLLFVNLLVFGAGQNEVAFQGSTCSGPANTNCNLCIAYQYSDGGCNATNNNGMRCGSIQCSSNDTNTFKACVQTASTSNYCTSTGNTTACSNDLSCKTYSGACQTKNFNGTYPGCSQPTCPSNGGSNTTGPVNAFSPCN